MYLSATPLNQPLSGWKLNSLGFLQNSSGAQKIKVWPVDLKEDSDVKWSALCSADVFWRKGGREILWRKGHTLILMVVIFFWFVFIAIDSTVCWHLMTIKLTTNYLDFLFFSCLFFNLVFGKNKKKVNNASEILYFYICCFFFLLSFFIYTPLSLDVFKWCYFSLFLCDFICLENVATKGISVFLNC